MSSVLDVTAEEMAVYRATARRRLTQAKHDVEGKKIHAMQTARRVASVLKQDYGARRVVLYGSLARDRGFHSRSDVDLAAWGLEETLFYRIVSRLLDLDSAVEINLVMGEGVSPGLLTTIEREGIEL